MPAAATLHRETARRSFTVRLASAEDRTRIYQLRHDVYARELGQHHCNGRGELTDPLDEFNEYLVVAQEDEIAGFLSITPPGGGRYSLDKYLPRAEWPFPIDDGLYELRLLTVVERHRSGPVAMLLMHAAQRYLQECGAARVMAIGRREVLEIYLKTGLQRLGPSFLSGAVQYDLMAARLDDIVRTVARFGPTLRALQSRVRWDLECAYFDEPTNGAPPTADAPVCYHGGAFFDAIGVGFETLGRRHEIINADVLDAWFPPAPAVVNELRENLDWALRTSPPTQCEGLIAEIARARGVPGESLVPGAGSSDLVFRACLRWLQPGARVLLLDPTYGEYQHVFEHVVPCRVDRLLLDPERGFVVDLDQLADRLKHRYDLVVLVNPNNPTGVHVRRQGLEPVLRDAPQRTRIWIDEAYLDYISPAESLERFAAASENVVVCKSMSKVYALSGARVAYLCGPRALMRDLRSITPPWIIGLPAQIAGVLALRDAAYYRARYAETRQLRDELGAALKQIGVSVWPGTANFLLCRLPDGAGDAAGLLTRCRQQGLFLRDVSSMTTRPDAKVFRMALKDGATNGRMVALLRSETEHQLQPAQKC
jgi:histidinol-phosphate/aromatic aminotransferase/cobyric acid decarboxylase-like protein